MNNIKTIEKYFRKFLKELDSLSPENYLKIDLDFLQRYDLLHFHEKKIVDLGLTKYFQVLETPDKITLINQEFLVWILPENIEGKNITYTLIALNKDKPKLELVYSMAGVYNSSHLVLSVLEKMLIEIEETEEIIEKIK